MRCPCHQVDLQRAATRWGGRWGCPVPGCTVACWEGSTSTPADAETRELRKRCHAAFDPLWRSRRPDRWLRSDLYGALASRLGLRVEDTHFGMFDAEQCRRALAVIADLARPQESGHA